MANFLLFPQNSIENINLLERKKVKNSYRNNRGWTKVKNRRFCSLKVEWKKNCQAFVLGGFAENDVLQKGLIVLPFRIPRVFFNGLTTVSICAVAGLCVGFARLWPYMHCWQIVFIYYWLYNSVTIVVMFFLFVGKSDFLGIEN